MDAIMRGGSPTMVNYTPSSAVDAGDVVVLGTDSTHKTPFVAHRDIAADEVGSLSIGGGIYEMTSIDALTMGDRVYFNATERRVTRDVGSTSGEPMFGIAAESCNANSVVWVLHDPDGTVSS